MKKTIVIQAGTSASVTSTTSVTTTTDPRYQKGSTNGRFEN